MKAIKKVALAVALAGTVSGSALAGSVFLTGHDIDLHNGADSYDVVILDFLRGAGTAAEIARANYDIGVIRSTGVGFVGGVLDGSPATFGTVTQRDPNDFADGAAFAAFLSTIDVLVVASHVNCGGCALTTDDSNTLNTFSTQIATFFNAGGDIFGNSGANLATYYNFLPAGVAASGPPISGSNGFLATAEGAAIGITSAMVNGDPTHNRFTTIAPAFTIMEVRPNTSIPGGQEIISIAVRDGTIVDDGIVVDDDGTDGVVPVPATIGLLGLGLLGLGFSRKRK